MNTYETLFVFPPDLPQDKLDAISDKIKKLISKHKGEIVSFKSLGKRRLAYPVKRYEDGNFHCLTFKAPSSLIAELDTLCRVSADVVVRYMTTRTKEEKRKAVGSKESKEEVGVDKP